MFAVPGWSISTSDLKPQREGSSKQHETSTPTAPDAATTATNENVAAGQSAKKRKRENGVTKSNVDEMFRQHIEGHTDNSSKKKQKNKEKEKKGKKENKQPGGNEEAQESTEAGEGSVNKKRKKARDEEKKPHTNGDTSATVGETSAVDNATITSAPLPPAVPPAAAKLTPLQQKMRDKLMSARFRHLNETLYTTPSKEAQAMFDANPELFTEYHNGFSRQVKESWPSNPVDGYIAAVRKRGAVPAHHHHDKKKNNNSNNPNAVAALPRRPNGLCTIADLGCGDAQFARSLTPSAKKLQLKLLSFDLQSPDDSLVTKADIANLPVTDGSVDVTIFCLSLMGTNWVSFVEEAWRVLRGDGKGECWVSEVKSRFGKVNRKKAQIGLKRDEVAMSNSQKKKLKNKKKKKNGSNDSDEDDADEDEEIYAEDAQQQQHPSGSGSNNNDDTDISAFIEVFKSRGFVLKQESVDKSNKMFVKMEFVKAGGAPTKGKYAGITPAPAGRNSEKPTQTKKRFIDRGRGDDEGSKGLTAEQEAKVLKPCVYKIR